MNMLFKTLRMRVDFQIVDSSKRVRQINRLVAIYTLLYLPLFSKIVSEVVERLKLWLKSG
jgi:hypothetical protein